LIPFRVRKAASIISGLLASRCRCRTPAPRKRHVTLIPCSETDRETISGLCVRTRERENGRSGAVARTPRYSAIRLPQNSTVPHPEFSISPPCPLSNGRSGRVWSGLCSLAGSHIKTPQLVSEKSRCASRFFFCPTILDRLPSVPYPSSKIARDNSREQATQLVTRQHTHTGY
jgi:hypothetical protein